METTSAHQSNTPDGEVDALLCAALTMFHCVGMRAVRIRDVAMAAGVSASLANRCFLSKAALLDAAVRAVTAPHSDPGRSPRTRMELARIIVQDGAEQRRGA